MIGNQHELIISQSNDFHKRKVQLVEIGVAQLKFSQEFIRKINISIFNHIFKFHIVIDPELQEVIFSVRLTRQKRMLEDNSSQGMKQQVFRHLLVELARNHEILVEA
ncbi:unnamed protein product [Kuraishia capsulata CBS 1993]|uniref:Uncharacterized protein n=1 Tax=Kuraishia capsulata CBS 1993 TaxID=1382522 RepID=W6MKA1_9ASCO|nr:uncharacterized protein KUCA_T00002750001 [Kuraishia capsulata CBS 1993]CDK26776.1 unnamed protein product [Kuraishia capsulata CBS 1993]